MSAGGGGVHGNTPPSAGSSTPSPNRKALQRSEVSWTDDLPLCELSDVGVAPNVVYLDHGQTMEAHQYEDYSFNFRSDNGCCLYGLFDGHDGVRAAHYAAFRLPAELLLGQLNPNLYPADASIRKVLHQAFSTVERGFFESLDDALAKKTHLLSQIPDRIPMEVAVKRFPETFQKIKDLEDQIRGGSTAVVALIINNKLFVANVGDSRALLCRLNKTTNRLEVKQLSIDHNIYQTQELNRLRNLGLNLDKIRNRGKLGMNEITRCIGDHSVKVGYRDVDYLRDARSEPVISEPSVTGGIVIDDYEGSFLILMSDDLYKSIQQVDRNVDPNEYVAQLTSREFLVHQGIAGVAQSVVDKITHMHKHIFGKQTMACRGDITLIVRNFTHPVGTKSAVTHLNEYPVSVPYDGIPTCEKQNIKLVMPPLYVSHRTSVGAYSSSTPSDDTPTNVGGSTSGFESVSTADATQIPPTAQAEEDEDVYTEEDFYRCDPNEQLQLDEDERVKPYITFEGFEEQWRSKHGNIVTAANLW